ncbi:hypothetical protein [Mycobacterium timonense]|jgi:hypothetical protein|uniref:Uncharacterized protein n=1 Tax=Mycobacterium timonense TaxID=701043 RepID=A0A7I9ZAX5_9MYCO|nr:hypothetical protein [Mycobacterium timonense]GFG98130.1 hypothetical protein MTIM_40090 [Mycobacterium timonense]
MRPTFIRAVPDEIERYGFAGAVLLAHIRFRCESDGPGRFERDGFRWWRVSRRDLGYEVGASADTVKRALEKLGDAVVSANNLDKPEDQTRAYRPTDDQAPLTCQKAESPRSDLPEGDIATDLGEIATPPRRNRHSTGAKSQPALPIETLEKREREGGEEGCAVPDEPGPLDAEIVPDPANAHPPQNQPDSTDPADAWVEAELVDDDPDPEPQQYCDRHMPHGTDGNCGACGRRRRIREKWEQRQQTSLLRGIFSKTAEPPQPVRRQPEPRPEPPSWVPGPDGRPRCRRHGHRKVAPVECAGCRDAAIAAEESA